MKANFFTPIKRIPFFLLTGFLGSGKTTFIKHIINHFADKKKLAIIQNEFAPANIDGVILKQTHKNFRLMEVNKGSVFCVCLLSDFRTSLRDFIDETKPDAIFLEASGLADPIAIAEFLNDKLFDDVYLAHVWCVVDALNFNKIRNTAIRVQHQIRIADSVIINKTDLNDDTIEIENFIRELNPFCKMLKAKECNIDIKNIFNFNISLAENQKKENAIFESSGKPDIGAAVLRTGKKISKKGLMNFLENFAKYTNRLKGYVVLEDKKVMAIQSCFGDYEIKEIENYHASTEIVAMGESITARGLKNAFEEKLTLTKPI